MTTPVNSAKVPPEEAFLTWDISSLAATQQAAQHIAEVLPTGGSLLLEGPLGAGKTTFCRFLLQALTGETTLTPSPTFALVHPYDTPKGSVWHMDLYRLTPAEVPALGLEDYWGAGICLVEWPDRLPYVPPEALWLVFSLSPSHRHLTLKGSPSWALPLRTLPSL